MKKIYLGSSPENYLPFDELWLSQIYFYPMWATLDWDKIKYEELKKNFDRLNDDKNSINEDIYLYINIPFCQSICHYCDFEVIKSNSVTKDYMGQYVEYLIKEIDFYMNTPYVQSRNLTAIHVGGGTPSTIPVKAMERLFKYLCDVIADFDKIETTFTGEARSLRNPEKLKLINDYGWNRLTWGIETLDENIKKQIGRDDTNEDVDAVFNELEKIGYKGDRCIDLMYHLPGQTLQAFQDELKFVVDTYHPEYIDAYTCVYLPYRALHRRIIKNKVDQPTNVWELLKMREYLCDFMEEKGYYNPNSETYSKNSNIPSHYQNGQMGLEDVIPFGLAARGYFKDMANINPQKLEEYMKNIDESGVSSKTLQSIGRNGVFNRIMIMWPRCKTLSKKILEDYKDVKDYDLLCNILKRHIKLGLVNENKDNYSLNKLGVIWHGNMQNEYMNHELNPIKKFAINKGFTLKKKDFHRNDFIVSNSANSIMWATRRQYPRHK